MVLITSVKKLISSLEKITISYLDAISFNNFQNPGLKCRANPSPDLISFEYIVPSKFRTRVFLNKDLLNGGSSGRNCFKGGYLIKLYAFVVFSFK